MFSAKIIGVGAGQSYTISKPTRSSAGRVAKEAGNVAGKVAAIGVAGDGWVMDILVGPGRSESGSTGFQAVEVISS
jgi:hypothetical protein